MIVGLRDSEFVFDVCAKCLIGKLIYRTIFCLPVLVYCISVDRIKTVREGGEVVVNW